MISHPSKSAAVNLNMGSYVGIFPTIFDFVSNSGREDAAKKRLGRSLLPFIGLETAMPNWNEIFGSHTFHEVTNYWLTRSIRERRHKYHRNIAWRLEFPFAAAIYGSLSWEDIRNSSDTDAMIGGRKLKDYFSRPPEEALRS